MHRPGLTHERLVALFVAGILAFTPPFLSIFNVPRLIVGIPTLYFYLFLAWAILIALIALVVARADREAPSIEGPARDPSEPRE